jgi:hypothetical protein
MSLAGAAGRQRGAGENALSRRIARRVAISEFVFKLHNVLLVCV